MYSLSMAENSGLFRGSLDRLLLAVLADGSGHGYELAQRLADRSGGELGVPDGSLYPALHRLERGGLVSSRWDVSAGRRRRVYSLTSAGERQLGAWRTEWSAFAGAVDRVLGVVA